MARKNVKSITSSKDLQALRASTEKHLTSAFFAFIGGYGAVKHTVWTALKTGQGDLIPVTLNSFVPDKEANESDKENFKRLVGAVKAAMTRYYLNHKEEKPWTVGRPKGAKEWGLQAPSAPRGKYATAEKAEEKTTPAEVNEHTFGLAINAVISTLDKQGKDGLRLVAAYVAGLIEDRNAKEKKAA